MTRSRLTFGAGRAAHGRQRRATIDASEYPRPNACPAVVTVTDTAYVVGPFPPGPTTCAVQAMTVTAVAMPGATIASAEIYTRFTISADSAIYDRMTVPLDSSFGWRSSACTVGGLPAPWTYPDNWYRLVITDSHGRVTEKIGPNP